jgi:hypothetical protein
MHLVSDTDSNMVLKRPLAYGQHRTSYSLLMGAGKCVAITFLSKTQAKFIFEVQHATTRLHNYGYNEALYIKALFGWNKVTLYSSPNRLNFCPN